MKKIIFLLNTLFFCSFVFGQKKYSLSDLVTFSKSQYGFLEKTGEIDQYYGDIECVSPDKNIFEFTIGCGKCGDIITLLIKENSSKPNSFDLYIQKGDIYFGKSATSNKKVGELLVISESELIGNIKLCMEKDYCCCGEHGQSFVLKKIN